MDNEFNQPLIIMKVKKITLILFSLFVAFLILSNPSEESFMKAVATDYGRIHNSQPLTAQMLRHLGKSSRQSYILFSRYDYQFGSIGVSYFGIGNMIFFTGSHGDTSKETFST